MTKRMILPLLFGLVGAAILIGLGNWQLNRLAWKRGILDAIEAQIAAAPVPLPAAPGQVADQYRAVEVSGAFDGPEIDVLASVKQVGPVYRVIASFSTDDGRRVLVDRGYVLVDQRDGPRAVTNARVIGNLLWPDEIDGYTPEPDLARGIWFARDVPALASALGTEPVLIVAREPTGDGILSLPVDPSGIPNDHLSYAITWFSLAAVWLGMTGLWLWRIRRTARQQS